jgi:MFS family permease
MVTKAPPGSWRIVMLLFFFMLINFADKAIIGLAAVPIMTDLHLTPSQFGLVGSSFFLLFAVSSIVVGFVCNSVPTRWVLLVMSAVWAVTQFPLVGPAGFTTLVACRVVLGAGEGPAYPVALHATYKWFPNELRTLPTAVISQGAGIGIVVALPLLNLIIVHYDWHGAFLALGIAGLVWCAAWAVWGREGPLEAPAVAGDAPLRIPYGQLMRNPTILASWAAFFGAYWALSLSLSWQGAYFVQGLGFAQSAAGPLTALTTGLGVVLTLGLGWYSQRLLTRGVPSRTARGLLGGGCVAAGGVALACLPLVEPVWPKILVGALGLALPSIIYALSHAVVSEITPPAQRGALLAIGNAIGTMAGLLAPFVMGNMVETAATALEGFNRGFVVCGIIMIVGGLIGAVFMRPERDAKRLMPALRPVQALAGG